MSTHSSTKHLSWKYKELYKGNEKTGFSVIKIGLEDFDLDSSLPDQLTMHYYRVKWPDDVLSKDFYNLSRAKDNAVKEWLKTCAAET